MNSHSDQTNILVREGCEASAAKALAQVLRACGWQRMNLGFMPSELASALGDPPGAYLRRRTERAMRYVPFEGTYESYLAAHPGLKTKIGRARRRLERDFGPITLDQWSGLDAVEKGFPSFVEVDAASWKARKQGGEALVRAPLPLAYYLGLTERLAQNGQVHVWVLRLGGSPAAAELTFEANGLLYDYKTSFSEKFASKGDQKPGFVMLSLVIEHAWPHFTGIDFISDSFEMGWAYETYRVQSDERIATNPWHWFRSPQSRIGL